MAKSYGCSNECSPGAAEQRVRSAQRHLVRTAHQVRQRITAASRSGGGGVNRSWEEGCLTREGDRNSESGCAGAYWPRCLAGWHEGGRIPPTRRLKGRVVPQSSRPNGAKGHRRPGSARGPADKATDRRRQRDSCTKGRCPQRPSDDDRTRRAAVRRPELAAHPPRPHCAQGPRPAGRRSSASATSASGARRHAPQLRRARLPRDSSGDPR